MIKVSLISNEIPANSNDLQRKMSWSLKEVDEITEDKIYFDLQRVSWKFIHL
jgi:hypothetical protein